MMSATVLSAETTWHDQKLASGSSHKGHLVASEVYTPVAHSRGHTFAVFADAQDHPTVIHVDPEGTVTTVPLDSQGDYRGLPDGHNGFSAGIDKAGFLHVTGDMHQFGPGQARHTKYAYPERYDDKKNAAMLYWRSRKPWSVEAGFEFRGARGSKHLMPGTSWTYGRFTADRNGELYYSARVRAFWAKNYKLPGAREGAMALGLYRYDVEKETWKAIGGHPDTDPDNTASHHRVLFWARSGRADTGGGYQVYQSAVSFDRANRMHVAVHAIVGPDNTSRLLYAYSDNGGGTWFKANGQPIPGLPLRGEDGEANLADTIADAGDGIVRVVVDADGVPAVNQGHSYKGSFVWDREAWTFRTDVPGHRGYVRPDGSLVFTSAWALWDVNRFAKSSMSVTEERPGLSVVSQQGVLETGVLYGLRVSKDGQSVSLHRMRRNEPPAT
jgi:hypothetical protein